MTPSRLDVRFEGRIRDTGAELEISYALENRTGVEIGVFDRIPGRPPDGTSDYPPEVAYVDLEGEVLNIQKAVLQIPRGLSVAARVVPDASRVPAGAVHEATFRLSVPVRVCHPYKKSLVRGEVVSDKPASASRAMFAIGFFEVGSDCRLISAHPAFPDVLTPFPTGPAVARQELASVRATFERPIAVLDYRGAEWK